MVIDSDDCSHVNTPVYLECCLQAAFWSLMIPAVTSCVHNVCIYLHQSVVRVPPTGTINLHWFLVPASSAGLSQCVKCFFFFFWDHMILSRLVHVFIRLSCFLLLFFCLLFLPNIKEVEVGTQTQQHDGCQHVVDQLPEFRLQVALPVPVYLRGREGKQIIGGTCCASTVTICCFLGKKFYYCSVFCPLLSVIIFKNWTGKQWRE